MKIEFENAGVLAYLMEEFANIIRNTEKNSENSVCNMTFGQALEALKEGKRVARSGWNGKGMYIYLADGKLLTEAIGEGVFTDTTTMKTADNKFVPWLASQADMLAEDWEIFE